MSLQLFRIMPLVALLALAGCTSKQQKTPSKPRSRCRRALLR